MTRLPYYIFFIFALSACSHQPQKNTQTIGNSTSSGTSSITKKATPENTKKIAPQKKKTQKPVTKKSEKQQLLKVKNKKAINKKVARKADTHHIWSRIKKGMKLQRYYNVPRVHARFKRYYSKQHQLQGLLEKSAPYLYHVVNTLEKKGIPLEVALLPIIESAYDPTALSSTGAAGIWQFTPVTAKHFKLKKNQWYDARLDPVASTQTAAQYLLYLHDFFDGNWLHAIAAYNVGEGTIRNAIRHNKRLGKPTDFWSLPLKGGAEYYVPQLLALSDAVYNHKKHRLRLTPLANKAAFTKVTANAQVDLKKVAKSTNLPWYQLKRLNEGYIKKLTPPKGPHHVLIPIHKASHLKALFANNTPEKWRAGIYHVVKAGDTLSSIGHKYNRSVIDIKAKNGLKSNTLKINQRLTIPLRENRKAAKKVATKPSSGKAKRSTSKIVKKTTGVQYTLIKHRVQKADSLTKISKKYQVRIKDIKRWNRPKPLQTLVIGEQVKVYVREKKSNG